MVFCVEWILILIVRSLIRYYYFLFIVIVLVLKIDNKGKWGLFIIIVGFKVVFLFLI